VPDLDWYHWFEGKIGKITAKPWRYHLKRLQGWRLSIQRQWWTRKGVLVPGAPSILAMAVWRNILKSPVKKGIDEISSYEKLSPSMAVSGETACPKLVRDLHQGPTPSRRILGVGPSRRPKISHNGGPVKTGCNWLTASWCLPTTSCPETSVYLAFNPEKWWSESHLGWWNSQYGKMMGKNKSHVPNHQPVII